LRLPGRLLRVALPVAAGGVRGDLVLVDLDLVAPVVDVDVLVFVRALLLVPAALLTSGHRRKPSAGSAAPRDDASLDHSRYDVAAQVVCEMPPVRGVEQDEIGVVARRDATAPLGTAEHVRCVEGAAGKDLGG